MTAGGGERDGGGLTETGVRDLPWRSLVRRGRSRWIAGVGCCKAFPERSRLQGFRKLSKRIRWGLIWSGGGLSTTSTASSSGGGSTISVIWIYKDRQNIKISKLNTRQSRVEYGSLLPSLFHNSPWRLGSCFVEADFPLNDMLPMETGLTEEAPFQLPFGLRGRAVLLSRNVEAGWLGERGIQKNWINWRP